MNVASVDGTRSLRSLAVGTTGALLAGRSLLVVGASAGIGRAVALAAVAQGADVVVAARRAGKLDELVAEAGGGHPVVADASDAGDCDRLTAEAVDRVGPLDAVVYAAGRAPLRALVDTGPDEWWDVLGTNVVGANQLVRAVVGAGRMSERGVVALLSSEAAEQARYGLGAYGASKAALDASVRAWRNEHPEVRFCRVVVGQTFPTEFGDGFPPDVLAAAFEHWGRHGLLQSEFMTPAGVAGVIVSTLAGALAHPDVGVHDVVLRSPSAPVGPAPAGVVAPPDGGGVGGPGGTKPSESPPGTKPPWVSG
jgi:NADP-dependent 3-hydroxy acid dehydrogenase YdfG